jgi:trans-aconitate methyltransferase
MNPTEEDADMETKDEGVKRTHERPGQVWNSNLYDSQLGFVSEYGKGVVDWLAPQPGTSVLDLGCGTGDLTALIASYGVEAEGIDAAAEMIGEAKRKYPALRFDVADAHHMRTVQHYDAVFSNAALHWMKRPADVIRGVWAALRPGGRFVGEFGAKGNVAHITAALERAIAKLGMDAASLNPWFFPSAGEYATLLEAQGFTVRRLVTFERPTRLNDEENGLRHWIDMFGGAYTAGLTEDQLEAVYEEIQQEVRPVLYEAGAWKADYVRLRFEAWKPV